MEVEEHAVVQARAGPCTADLGSCASRLSVELFASRTKRVRDQVDRREVRLQPALAELREVPVAGEVQNALDDRARIGSVRVSSSARSTLAARYERKSAAPRSCSYRADCSSRHLRSAPRRSIFSPVAVFSLSRRSCCGEVPMSSGALGRIAAVSSAPLAPETVEMLSEHELRALAEGAAWFAKYHERMIADQADVRVGCRRRATNALRAPPRRPPEAGHQETAPTRARGLAPGIVLRQMQKAAARHAELR